MSISLPDTSKVRAQADAPSVAAAAAKISLFIETCRKALERGAEGLVTKPIDFVALRQEIDTRLGNAA